LPKILLPACCTRRRGLPASHQGASVAPTKEASKKVASPKKGAPKAKKATKRATPATPKKPARRPRTGRQTRQGDQGSPRREQRRQNPGAGRPKGATVQLGTNRSVPSGLATAARWCSRILLLLPSRSEILSGRRYRRKCARSPRRPQVQTADPRDSSMLRYPNLFSNRPSNESASPLALQVCTLGSEFQTALR